MYLCCSQYLTKIMINAPKENEPLHGKTDNLQRRKQRRRSASLNSAFVFATLVQLLYFLNPNFQPPTIFCDCTARFVSDLVGTQIVGFLMHRLKCLPIRKLGDNTYYLPNHISIKIQMYLSIQQLKPKECDNVPHTFKILDTCWYAYFSSFGAYLYL